MSDLVLDFMLPPEVVVEGGGDVRALPVRVLSAADPERCTVVLGEVQHGGLREVVGFAQEHVRRDEEGIYQAIAHLQVHAATWMAENARRKKMLRGW